MRWTLDPKNDAVFNMLFADPARKGLLIRLLTAVLRPKRPIRDAVVQNPKLPRAVVGDRGIVLDIHATLDDGSLIDVELQQVCHAHLSERIVYYWSRLNSSQLKAGQPYSRLRPCISIVFMGQRLLPGSRFHSTFRVLEIHDHRPLAKNALEIHVVELPKLARAKRDSELTQWARFFAAKTDAELEALAMNYPHIAEAKVALDALSADKEAREIARMRELAQANLAIIRHGSLEEGFKKGQRKGRKEGLLEATRSLADVLNLPLGKTRQRKLQAMSLTELETLVKHLRAKRAWPKGF
jgi:predicted transposase/invertase (TIGR01784 family)